MAVAAAELRVSRSSADHEDDQPAVNRRALLAGMVAAAAIGTNGATTRPLQSSLPERISALATELAALMQEMHGGAWHTAVDHDVQIVMIAPGL
ncbi:hypothetical protein [Mesorhizobium sp. ES1-4]|uniref:hypothetical protein n=1 Tax=Mesorhizobium sp. ES1-4 TaxID=2876627 RepID=UPI001CCE4C6E|nr:hypothetical protein [Mesorhizobium sp. ES1-4]MBZ9794331.1 hypothetical protein [Mesorhizobium sp. ES1-4]